ncbi:ubiquitin carboxyl-terminal hydrolase, family 1 [Nitzschia inconspicua]|uniref:Ubiquitin carboxyl-terminal hydrolase n=1 Tax=Nitzschia inconspicua TaxID=303405 RepID=A0A9K3Q3V7_9STRA|nr:ubiquitin carboxyl-terminal hydrolase, family 1 [Nitzschia inconspicua]
MEDKAPLWSPIINLTSILVIPVAHFHKRILTYKMSDDDWCTIESDPGVFTELLGEIGCTAVQLEELWSLDDETLNALNETGEIYGLIFLFQWKSKSNEEKTDAAKETLSEEQIPESLFFAHQVTTNACATQAILSVLLNQGDKIELGPTLKEFKDFTASFPPSLKGVAISGCEPIKKAHNAFGRTDAFLNDGKFVSRHSATEDVFHFVAYTPQNGTVYELDGLQSGPIVVGKLSDDEQLNVPTKWLSLAREAIQKRMEGDAIKFNLMAVIKDKRLGLKEMIERDPSNEGLVHQLQMEEEKRKQWTLENQRRRHNYVPLCVSILKELARANKLPQLVEEAKERKRQKLANAKALKTG